MSEIAPLLKAIASKDKVAFSALYRLKFGIMCHYASALLAQHRSDAEDITDEAFMTIWQKAGSFNSEGSAEGWMKAIVRNKVYDFLRKQRATYMINDKSDLIANIADNADLPDQRLLTGAAQDELLSAMQRLSIEHREAIHLCYFENKSIGEIGNIIGKPIGTVKTRLFYARQALREILKEGIND